LAKIDQYRNFQAEGFSFQYAVNDPADPATPASVMRVYLKKADRNAVLCVYLSPADQQDRRILVQKNSFWLLDRSMRDPIRISARQMMFGQASAGDITRISYATTYQVEKSTSQGETVVLNLAALKDVEVSYPVIRLRIRSSDSRPIKAELFAATGTILKTIDYTDFQVFSGKTLLSGFTITNLLNRETSRVVLDKFSPATLADRYFSQGGMKVLP